MPYDRDSRYDRDDDRRSERGDHGPPFGSGRESGYSGGRDYRSSGQIDGRDRDDQGRSQYGRPGYGAQSYGRSDYGAGDHGERRYGQGGYRPAGDGGRPGFDRSGHDRSDGPGYRQPGYGQDRGRERDGHPDDRGFFDRAGDEVRSWFGDEEAERRRDMDQRHAERTGQTGRGLHDDDYHSWRSSQISSLDRDYEEYRRENRSKFEKEFSDWRSNRQAQRQSLTRVTEHQEVVGSDGEHVGTVDKVRGDRVILTRNDKDAGGQHHSVPCGWIASVDDKVTLNKTAEQAKQAWRDEERSGAMSGRDGRQGGDGDGSTGRTPDRSFPGSY